MPIDSVVIKLTKRGAGVSPDYSLTIYGKGDIVYEGKENVEVKGIAKEPLEKEKIMSLLTEFKKTDFFSLNDVYPVEKSNDRPYTIVSISTGNQDGVEKTKSITHYQDDKNVPKELINLEEKIEEMVGSNKWIGATTKILSLDRSDIKGEKQILKVIDDHDKKSKSSKKKPLPGRLIAGVILIVIIVVLILYVADCWMWFPILIYS